MKYSLKRHLLKESVHEAKLAKLLTSPVPHAVQGAQLGDPLKLVRDFDHFPMPFDQAHIVQVETPQTLADLIRNEAPIDLVQTPLDDGWVASSYAIPESFN